MLRNNRRGSALVVSVIFITLASMVVGYVMLASNRQMRNTYRSRLFTTSLAAAATTVDSMTQQAYFLAMTRPQGKFSLLNDTILNIQPKQLPGYITAKNSDGDPLTFFKATRANNGSEEEITDATDDWAGFKIRRWSYDAVAFVNASNDPDGVAATDIDPSAERLGFEGAGFKAHLEINYIPLYQYAIFYDNDLELHTGPDIDVMGPVHSNHDLWLATAKSLTFSSKVTAAGQLHSYRDFSRRGGDLEESLIPELNSKRAYGPDGSKGTRDDWLEMTGSHDETVRIKKKGTNGYEQLNNNISLDLDTNHNTFLDSKDTSWMENALDRWSGNVKDSAMGVKPVRPPLPFVTSSDGTRAQADAAELIQRIDSSDSHDMKDAKMESKADLIIEGDPSVTEVLRDEDGHAVTDKNGNDIYVPSNITFTDTSGNPVMGADGQPIQNVDYSGGGAPVPLVTAGEFHDNRQEKVVNTFDVNIEEIVSRDIPFDNGLLYVSPVGGEMGSVRLTNATEMPAGKNNTFTVATDRPLYLEGDVNTGENRIPLLLAADAITITSQHLTNDNTDNNHVPDADRSTETNAIFMLGQVSSKFIDEETGEVYDHYVEGTKRIQMSGGAHNVLRYLEDWGGKTHTYNGSLICLFESRVATGDFWRRDSNGNHKSYYSPPTRDYNWDDKLEDSEPPAGMPQLVEVTVSRLERISKAEAVAALDGAY